MKCLALVSLMLVKVILLLALYSAQTSGNTSRIEPRIKSPDASGSLMLEKRCIGRCVGGLKLHELGSVLMRLMLADSLYGHSLLSNRASGLTHYFHLSKDMKIEKRGTWLECRLHQMSRFHPDTKVFWGHKPG